LLSLSLPHFRLPVRLSLFHSFFHSPILSILKLFYTPPNILFLYSLLINSQYLPLSLTRILSLLIICLLSLSLFLSHSHSLSHSLYLALSFISLKPTNIMFISRTPNFKNVFFLYLANTVKLSYNDHGYIKLNLKNCFIQCGYFTTQSLTVTTML
jgi:hypothetical protein